MSSSLVNSKASTLLNVSSRLFRDYEWQRSNTLQGKKLMDFLSSIFDSHVVLQDFKMGLEKSPMNVRLTPYIASRINWDDFENDPLRKQFLPSVSNDFQLDHPMLRFDSLDEMKDSPVNGLVHRYRNKALFLALSVCPVYCRFCTRSYGIGGNTSTIQKKGFLPIEKRWEKVFEYIRNTPQLKDIVVSGGDSFYLEPQHVLHIGKSLLEIPHIKRIRFATKGLSVAPMRFLSDTEWTGAIEQVVNMGRMMGKHVVIHTHINHPNEISEITEEACDSLFKKAIPVRNQTVLLRGVNDSVEVMSTLIQKLSDMNVQPYYVYQGDMVKGVEDLRTPLSTILELEKQIRGTNSGFYTPNFVVDLPGGGGKRLACSYKSYDRESGIAVYEAPGTKGDREFYYFDPLHSLEDKVVQQWQELETQGEGLFSNAE